MPAKATTIPNAWPLTLAPLVHAVLKPFKDTQDYRLQSHVNAFATFQCPIQVEEFCIMWREAKKHHGLLHAYMIGFRRVGYLDGPGSFLEKSDDAYATYAGELDFPEPLPLAGQAPGKARVVHTHWTRKVAQRYFREGLRNLQGVGLERIHPEDRPRLPRVKPRQQCQLPGPTPMHGPDSPEAMPLSPEQLQDLRGSTGATTRNSDSIQSATYVAAQEETKYRPYCMRELQGKHLVWNKDCTKVNSINPPPGRKTRPHYPQETPRSGELLARHVQRLPGMAPGCKLPPEQYVFRNRKGGPLTPSQCASILRWTGRLEEVEGLVSSRLRAGVITLQAFTGTSMEDGPLVNGRRGHLTDWIYFRPEIEDLLYGAMCDADAVPRIDELPCCKACGDLGPLNADLLCSRCDPQATHGDLVAEDRMTQLVKLAAELEKELPLGKARNTRIHVDSNSNRKTKAGAAA